MTISFKSFLGSMPYTVSKLTDFSAAALDGAVRELLSALDQESAATGSENDWKAFRDRWMARKNGILTQLNDLWLKAAPKAAKRDVGQRVNKLREDVQTKVEHCRIDVENRELGQKIGLATLKADGPADGAKFKYGGIKMGTPLADLKSNIADKNRRSLGPKAWGDDVRELLLYSG